jgi:hypothetical protein
LCASNSRQRVRPTDAKKLACIANPTMDVLAESIRAGGIGQTTGEQCRVKLGLICYKVGT